MVAKRHEQGKNDVKQKQNDGAAMDKKNSGAVAGGGGKLAPLLIVFNAQCVLLTKLLIFAY